MSRLGHRLPLPPNRPLPPNYPPPNAQQHPTLLPPPRHRPFLTPSTPLPNEQHAPPRLRPRRPTPTSGSARLPRPPGPLERRGNRPGLRGDVPGAGTEAGPAQPPVGGDEGSGRYRGVPRR